MYTDNSMEEDPSDNSLFYSANKTQEQYTEEASKYYSEKLLEGLKVGIGPSSLLF